MIEISMISLRISSKPTDFRELIGKLKEFVFKFWFMKFVRNLPAFYRISQKPSFCRSPKWKAIFEILNPGAHCSPLRSRGHASGRRQLEIRESEAKGKPHDARSTRWCPSKTYVEPTLVVGIGGRNGRCTGRAGVRTRVGRLPCARARPFRSRERAGWVGGMAFEFEPSYGV